MTNPQQPADDTVVLADLMRRILSDLGWVDLRVFGDGSDQLILDGRIPLTADERAAVDRALRAVL